MSTDSQPNNGRLRPVLWTVTAVMVLVAGVFTVLTITRARSNADDAAEAALQTASWLPDPIPAPGVSMPTTTGAKVPLVETAPDTLNVLYFGYTHCPDVCPLSMTALSAAMRELSPADRARIRVVFVTVDPDRDTAASLGPWLKTYSASYIGAVPTLNQSDAVLQKMGYAKTTTQTTPGGNGYAVSHPGGMFVFTDDGKAHVIFTSGSPPDQIAHDLELLLDGWHMEDE